MLLSKYLNEFNSSSPLNEYPRPLLVRDSYLCLNGPWDFKISKSESFPESYDNKIIVPYCVESVLSCINKQIEDDDILYYRKVITFNKKFIKDKVLLHIDAVDQLANIYINKKLVYKSFNGYLPIVVNIKPYLKEKDNEIIIQVKDSLDLNYPYGKQKKKRGGMWYSKVSGIYQSVWIESVYNDYVKDLTIIPNIDKSSCLIIVNSLSDKIKIKVFDNDKLIYKESSLTSSFNIKIDNPKLWSPENPFLYDVIITTKNDEIKTYFALRKFEVKGDKLLLNNKPYFIFGLLDQGYFSDGIYTPCTYKAYEDDILTMKELGFNCLRKHIKIEPMMFYHYCDKHGMIVFQDLVNNGKYNFFVDSALALLIQNNNKLIKSIKKVNEKQKEIFKESAIDTINYLFNVPSVLYYTIFNEGWGQHDSNYYYDLLKEIDNSRVFDSTSGWFKEDKSDVLSLHVYFKKIKIKKSSKPIIVSEFGGYAYKVKNHVFDENKYYGYKKFKNIDDYNLAIKKLFENEIINNIKNGLCGCIYTQVSDVEDEINGLLTYDRKVLKIDKEMIKEIKNKIDKEFYYD